MLLKHFFLNKIAHSSYILAGKKTCAVIDPQRDVEIYIEEARNRGLTITHILQTHLHADFVSGHMDLAEKTGAKIYAPASADCAFEHIALKEGDQIDIEDMRLEVMETPGHTPEHIVYTVTDLSRGNKPIGVFVGDVLFVGDVGRPDLFPNRAEELAGKLYHSLHDKLLKLPDYCEIYPAHGAGSLCGRSMGAKWQSTIGYERLYNSALQIKDRQEFIKSLTTNMPPAPDHFSRCSEINRAGPALVSSLPGLNGLAPSEFLDKLHDESATLLDVRSYAAFSGIHISNSWHLDLKGNFPTFTGWVMPPDKPVFLVTDGHDDAIEAVTWARRVGIDQITSYLQGGIVTWATEGFKSDHIHLVSAQTLHDQITGSSDIVLIDVRAPGEFADSHIEGAVNIPVAELRTRYSELNPEKPTYLICSTGNRSSLAASILKQHGFSDVYNVAGGMTGYSAAGHAKQCNICVNPHGPRYAQIQQSS